MTEFVNLLHKEARLSLTESLHHSRMNLGLYGLALQRLPQIVNLVKDYIHIRRHKNKGLSQIDQELFRVFYGERSSILGNKAEFPDLIREVGFPSPLSILIRPGQDLHEAIKQIQGSLGTKKTYFVKPLD
jgi:hypothetical protein